MAEKEKATPITPDEIEDIRVTLELEDGEVECEILTIFDVGEQDYIALMPLNPDGSENEDGEVYLYRYAEDAEGLPQIDFIDGNEEYEAAAERFDELLDEEMFDSMDE
jgi:uncharacterized protein YrzB (UPF0473 family)